MEKHKGRGAGKLFFFLKIFLPVVILISGAFGGYYLKKQGRRHRKHTPEIIIPAVETIILESSFEKAIVRGLGIVVPAKKIILRSRVSGLIQWVSKKFIPGSIFKKGENILKIDPVDYELALAEKKSIVAEAVYALKLEMGHQEVAKKEWSMLGIKKSKNPHDTELALRKPHLEKARAKLAAAKAALKKARLDLERTKITAPFNSMVLEKYVDSGSVVSARDKLAVLFGIDAYWIEVLIPIYKLEWIDISGNEKGSVATVIYGNNKYKRYGRVIKLMGDIGEKGQMARILVKIDDPVGFKNKKSIPPLLTGEYIKVEIQGKNLGKVFMIPRNAIHDNDKIWLANDDNRLIIRKIEPVWTDMKYIMVKNTEKYQLKDGDKLIISNISGAMDGMKIRLASQYPLSGKSEGDR